MSKAKKLINSLDESVNESDRSNILKLSFEVNINDKEADELVTAEGTHGRSIDSINKLLKPIHGLSGTAKIDIRD